MKKLLIIVIVLGVAGWLVYRHVLQTPEARACDRLAELCGDDGKTASCEEDLAELRRMVGPEAMEHAAGCVEQSDACVEAVACMATGVFRGAGEVMEGIRRGLEQE